MTTPHDSKSLFLFFLFVLFVLHLDLCVFCVCVCVCVSFWRRFDVKLFDFLFFLSFFCIRDDSNQLGCIASIASIELIAKWRYLLWACYRCYSLSCLFDGSGFHALNWFLDAVCFSRELRIFVRVVGGFVYQVSKYRNSYRAFDVRRILCSMHVNFAVIVSNSSLRCSSLVDNCVLLRFAKFIVLRFQNFVLLSCFCFVRQFLLSSILHSRFHHPTSIVAKLLAAEDRNIFLCVSVWAKASSYKIVCIFDFVFLLFPCTTDPSDFGVPLLSLYNNFMSIFNCLPLWKQPADSKRRVLSITPPVNCSPVISQKVQIGRAVKPSSAHLAKKALE